MQTQLDKNFSTIYAYAFFSQQNFERTEGKYLRLITETVSIRVEYYTGYDMPAVSWTYIGSVMS